MIHIIDQTTHLKNYMYQRTKTTIIKAASLTSGAT